MRLNSWTLCTPNTATVILSTCPLTISVTHNKRCNFISVVPTNIYGKHDNFDLESGHVIPALVHKCYIANRTGGDFKVLGSGKPLRQFIYNVDLGGLIVWALEEYNESDPLILSTSEEDEVSISHVSLLTSRYYTSCVQFY